MTDTALPVRGGSPALLRHPFPNGCPSAYFRGATSARNAFYAEPDISVNTMLSWSDKLQVQEAFNLSHVDEGPLSSRHRAAGNACGAACIRSAFPFHHNCTAVLGVPTIRYVEIEVTQLGSKGKIAVGVVHGQHAMQVWLKP